MRRNNRERGVLGTGHGVLGSGHWVLASGRAKTSGQAARITSRLTRLKALCNPHFGEEFIDEHGELCRNITKVEMLIGLVCTAVGSVLVLAVMYVLALWVGGRG